MSILSLQTESRERRKSFEKKMSETETINNLIQKNILCPSLQSTYTSSKKDMNLQSSFYKDSLAFFLKSTKTLKTSTNLATQTTADDTMTSIAKGKSKFQSRRPSNAQNSSNRAIPKVYKQQGYLLNVKEFKPIKVDLATGSIMNNTISKQKEGKLSNLSKVKHVDASPITSKLKYSKPPKQANRANQAQFLTKTPNAAAQSFSSKAEYCFQLRKSEVYIDNSNKRKVSSSSDKMLSIKLTFFRL